MAKQSLRGFRTPAKLAGCSPQTPVLLALSGGADSRALLHLLWERSRLDGFPLLLCHVDHGIRGAEAARDRDFCIALAKDYGLELCVFREDVPTLAKQMGKGLEETAREVRYARFAELMEARKIPLLVTAHHADDNLETLLFRLCRGSGPRGLCGIAPSRPFATGTLVRPLLENSRNDILTYCRENGLQFVTDSTNADTAYARNRLRACVTPVLEELFQAPQLRATQAAADLCEDEAYLASLADALYARAATPQGLLLKELADAPAPLVKRTLMRWIGTETGSTPERVHVQGIMALLTGAHPNGEVALAGDCYAALELGLLRLFHRTHSLPESQMPTFCEGSVLLADRNVRITVEKVASSTKVHNLSTQSYIILNFDSVIMKDGLHWRTQREGDTLLQGGMHKKLKKLYSGVQLSAARRHRLPLLCMGEEILWAPFGGVRDGVQQDGNGYLVCVELLSHCHDEKQRG